MQLQCAIHNARLFSHNKVVKTYLHYDEQRIVAISRSILSLTEARQKHLSRTDIVVPTLRLRNIRTISVHCPFELLLLSRIFSNPHTFCIINQILITIMLRRVQKKKINLTTIKLMLIYITHSTIHNYRKIQYANNCNVWLHIAK